MAQPGATSRVVLGVIWLPVGLAMIGAPVWVAATRFGAILAGHPSTVAVLVGVVLLGVLAVAWAIASLVRGGRYDRYGDPDHPRHRTAAELRKRGDLRLALSVPALVVGLLLVAGVVYIRPFEATPPAVAALQSDDQVQITNLLTWYEMTSARRTASGDLVKPTTGLIFVPGARVDPRAYARLLRPLAAAGYLVAVLREPLNFAFPFSNHPAAVLDVHPEIRHWVIAGHSLGGVSAAAFSDRDRRIAGLLLYASYPAAALTRPELKAMSISGDRDLLATPADIAASHPKLPASTRFVVIRGGIHAFFGDYGDQPGDGVPGVDRETAQAQIRAQTANLLRSLTPAPKKR